MIAIVPRHAKTKVDEIIPFDKEGNIEMNDRKEAFFVNIIGTLNKEEALEEASKFGGSWSIIEQMKVIDSPDEPLGWKLERN